MPASHAPRTTARNARAVTAPEYFDTIDAARYLGVSVQYLEIGRCRGYGPVYVRVGGKCIRYKRSVLDQWMLDRLVDPSEATSAEARAGAAA